MVFHQGGGLTSEWSFIKVVFHQGGLSSGLFFIRGSTVFRIHRLGTATLLQLAFQVESDLCFPWETLEMEKRTGHILKKAYL